MQARVEVRGEFAGVTQPSISHGSFAASHFFSNLPGNAPGGLSVSCLCASAQTLAPAIDEHTQTQFLPGLTWQVRDFRFEL